jgi:hypothetical protein
MSTPERRPSRRFRVNTRELMALVLLIGAALGWVVNRAHTQRDAVAAIRRAGGYVRYQENNGWLEDSPGLSRWLASQVGVDYFDTVVSVGCRPSIVDADLAAVGRLAGLESLSLDGAASITDDGLKHLKGLRHLKRLGLSGTAVTNRGLAYLAGIASLESLQLEGTQVDGAGMEHLRVLPNLGSLNLRRTRVDDAGLERLGGSPLLHTLSLEGDRITDAGLASLESMPRLSFVGLVRAEAASPARAFDDARITDAGLAHLSKLPNLTYLWLRNARATDGGIARFDKASFTIGWATE